MAVGASARYFGSSVTRAVQLPPACCSPVAMLMLGRCFPRSRHRGPETYALAWCLRLPVAALGIGARAQARRTKNAVGEDSMRRHSIAVVALVVTGLALLLGSASRSQAAPGSGFTNAEFKGTYV